MTKISDQPLYPRAFYYDDGKLCTVMTIFEPGGRGYPATRDILYPSRNVWCCLAYDEQEVERWGVEIPRADPLWVEAAKRCPVIRAQQKELGLYVDPNSEVWTSDAIE